MDNNLLITYQIVFPKDHLPKDFFISPPFSNVIKSVSSSGIALKVCVMVGGWCGLEQTKNH